MAGLQRHLFEFTDIPGADDDPARIRIVAQQGQRRADLVDLAAIGRAPAAPLAPVDRSELTLRVSIGDIRIAATKALIETGPATAATTSSQ